MQEENVINSTDCKAKFHKSSFHTRLFPVHGKKQQYLVLKSKMIPYLMWAIAFFKNMHSTYLLHLTLSFYYKPSIL